MLSKKLFPCALAACFALVLPLVAAAQTGELRQRLVKPVIKTYDPPMVEKEPVIISLASAEDIKASKPLVSKTSGLQYQQLLSSAIEVRLGSPYRWGATGPSSFDCSGFVWSIYQSAGLGFERASARTLWSRFAAPDPEEQYKFGTLVFFSNLAHVGIVADEQGFYHASRHHGVVYSPFNEYWLKRIDGFRKVPVAPPVSPDNSPVLAAGSVAGPTEH
ncbi:MAG TPA: C40 family peptidase [Pyrinomonadaceae bacterium]|nr:C40 family peptidase [Pyrinomonadaceae bacterium]